MNLKKGIIFTPLPPIWTNVSFSAIFFFWMHPLAQINTSRRLENFLNKKFFDRLEDVSLIQIILSPEVKEQCVLQQVQEDLEMRSYIS